MEKIIENKQTQEKLDQEYLRLKVIGKWGYYFILGGMAALLMWGIFLCS